MKREEAVKLVETGFDELAKSLEAGRSDELVQWMAVTARFYNYSFRNCMLIARQKPDATFVAGFRAWPKLGRHVRKGERGIAILAPLVYKRKEDDGGTEEYQSEESGKVLAGFKVTHVFDVSQTEGQELPELHDVEGDPGPWIERLEEVIDKAGIVVEEENWLGGADGLSQGGRIKVLKNLSPARRFAVLAHEYAHETLHKGGRRQVTNRKIRETEAEAVACIVAKAVGLDAEASASDYIQMYSGDVKLLMGSLEEIQKVAASILERLLVDKGAKEVAV